MSDLSQKLQDLMADSPEAVETDAVHHRLLGPGRGAVTVRDVGYRYDCYDCSSGFETLEQLAEHAHRKPPHSQELCLKCGRPITVFCSLGRAVRLHSCRRSSLRHQNSDLNLLSSHLHSRLDFDPHDDATIVCPTCSSRFARSPNGVYGWLRHCNDFLHTLATHCTKCNLPRFQLAGLISHFCVKHGKAVVVNDVDDQSLHLVPL